MYSIKVTFDRNLGLLRNKMQDIMDEMMNLRSPIMSPSHTGWLPEADLYETEKEIFLVADLGGVRKEDIQISLFENVLRLKGRRYPGHLRVGATRYHRLEMGYGDFERLFRIPASINAEKVEATYADGLLTVHMQKRVPCGVQVDVRGIVDGE